MVELLLVCVAVEKVGGGSSCVQAWLMRHLCTYSNINCCEKYKNTENKQLWILKNNSIECAMKSLPMYLIEVAVQTNISFCVRI